MKAKLKDIILYSLAIVGAVTLFINATTNSQQTTSTVPESHVWEMHLKSGAHSTFAFSINKVTGEVRKYETNKTTVGKGGDYFGAYKTASDEYKN
jgi:hypothetical protein